MSLHIRQHNKKRDVQDIYIRTGSDFRRVVRVFTRQNGTLRTIYQAAPKVPVTFNRRAVYHIAREQAYPNAHYGYQGRYIDANGELRTITGIFSEPGVRWVAGSKYTIIRQRIYIDRLSTVEATGIPNNDNIFTAAQIIAADTLYDTIPRGVFTYTALATRREPDNTIVRCSSWVADTIEAESLSKGSPLQAQIQ